MTVKQTVFNLLDEHEEMYINGWQLFDYVLIKTGRHCYPTTLLGFCREYCDITGGDFECIAHNESQYHFTRCIQLGQQAIIDRR